MVDVSTLPDAPLAGDPDHPAHHGLIHAVLKLIDAAGDLLVGSGADTIVKLAKGTALQYLRVNAAGTALEWASLAAVAAKQYAEIQTSEATSSGTFTDLATVGPSVTVTVGASGVLDIDLGCRVNGNGYMGFVLSGANVRAVNGTTDVLLLNGSGLQNASRTVVLTGLAPGVTTVTAKYAAGSGTPAFAMRTIAAVPK